jgi:hypothetical protein
MVPTLPVDRVPIEVLYLAGGALVPPVLLALYASARCVISRVCGREGAIPTERTSRHASRGHGATLARDGCDELPLCTDSEDHLAGSLRPGVAAATRFLRSTASCDTHAILTVRLVYFTIRVASPSGTNASQTIEFATEASIQDPTHLHSYRAVSEWLAVIGAEASKRADLRAHSLHRIEYEAGGARLVATSSTPIGSLLRSARLFVLASAGRTAPCSAPALSALVEAPFCPPSAEKRSSGAQHKSAALQWLASLEHADSYDRRNETRDPG